MTKPKTRGAVEDHPNKTGRPGHKGLPGNDNLVPVDDLAVQNDLVGFQVFMRQERERQMVSADAVGRMCGLSGSTIRNFELDQSNLNVEQFLRALRALGYKVQLVSLVTGKPK